MITAATSMREYAVAKTGTLLDEAVTAIQQAVDTPDEAAVHKMRVSIRRLQQAIRLFRQYLKRSGAKQVKARLQAIMQIAGELRNRDIAMGFVSEIGGDVSELNGQRLQYQQKLKGLLKQYATVDLASTWRGKLGLEAE